MRGFMIKIEEKGATLFLDLLEASLKEARQLTEDEIGVILSTGFMAFMIDAYGLAKYEMAAYLRNLGNDTPVSKDPVKAMFEEGFRSCYDLKRIKELRRNVEAITKIDYRAAEELALLYLPPRTDIECTVYVTVDEFNPAMVRNGNMGLSILTQEVEGDISYLAHEFHHLGFNYWLSKSPSLKSEFQGKTTYESVAIRLVLHLTMEGMANHFCTPWMVKTGAERSQRDNDKIRRYEENITAMLGEVVELLSDCVHESASAEDCEERLMNNIILDLEKILPPVHYIGANIIGRIEEKKIVERRTIIDLCRKPDNLLVYYSKVAESEGWPRIPEEVQHHVVKLIRERIS
jgi:hypothetical protein